MRITTNYIYRMSENSISDNYTRISKLQNELSSGIHVGQSEVDPVGMAAITRLQGRMDSIKQGSKNALQAKLELQTEETQLNFYSKVMQSVRTVVNKAAHGTSNEGDMKRYAAELKQSLEQLVSIANTKNQDGRSIFAGTKVADDAYEVTRDSEGKITAVTYQGDDHQQKINLASGVTVKIYQSGNEIFGSDGDSAFQNIIDFAERLETGEKLSEEEISAQLKTVTSFIDKGSAVISKTSNDYRLADFETSMHNSLSAGYLDMVTRLRDADFPTTTSELSKHMTLLQATMAASAQLEKLSIFTQL